MKTLIVYYSMGGNTAYAARRIAQALGAEIEALYPDCDVEVHMGGQPLYYYLIAVE